LTRLFFHFQTFLLPSAHLTPEILQMEASLLKLLCAPGTHASLRLANEEELRLINRLIGLQLIRERTGELLHSQLEACLVCEADHVCYPICDGLPVLIPDAAFQFPNPD
jgi:uncharacterized protein YbaR (Trm112 family)